METFGANIFLFFLLELYEIFKLYFPAKVKRSNHKASWKKLARRSLSEVFFHSAGVINHRRVGRGLGKLRSHSLKKTNSVGPEVLKKCGLRRKYHVFSSTRKSIGGGGDLLEHP